MALFNVSFQHPLESGEQHWPALTGKAAIAHFTETDWVALNAAVYQQQDNVMADFYFYELRYEDNTWQQEFCLNISGQYTYGKELEEKGPLFTIRYFYPVEATVKRFFGLGASRTEVQQKELMREDCDLALVQKCLDAFTRTDFDNLRLELAAHAPAKMM